MITKKLHVLKEANVIDEQTESFVLTIHHYLLEKNVIEDETNLDMFLTHLAMANMRQKNNETVIEMDENTRNEIASNPKLGESKKLWQELEKFSSTNFDQDEIWFIYMHIINILSKER